MKKKLLIILIFISFFFIKPTPIYAISGFEVVWNWITISLSHLIGINITNITNNENPSVLDQTNTFTDYTAKNQDEANRITPSALKKYYKGVWFYEILTTDKFGKDKKNKALTIDDKTTCHEDITITDIVCFYKKQEIKVLYKRGNKEPIEYNDETLTDKLNCKELDNPNPDICYQNLYINYQDIPQGFFEGLTDIAPAVSTQLNETMRLTIPQKGQGSTAPTDNYTAEKAEIIALDTDKQEMFKLVGLIPKNSHQKIPCFSNDTNFDSSDNVELFQRTIHDTTQRTIHDTAYNYNQSSKVLGTTTKDDKEKNNKNREYLRENFKQWLIPKSWQTTTNQVDLIDLSDVKPNINCPEDELRKSGYSEFGALGMAMSGIKYQEILERYFDTKEDDKYSVKKIPNFTTKDYIVKVELLEKWRDSIDTPDGTKEKKEKYQRCIDLANDETLKGEIDYEIINITESKTYQKHPTSSTTGKARLGYDGEVPDPNYDCKNNNPQEYNSWTKERKKIWDETEHDEWNKNCTYRVTMSVDDYLMGIAEIFNGWHVEAWKSLIVACRNNLFREEINGKTITTPNCIQQAFRCKTLYTNKLALNAGKYTNSATAVAATDNQFLVDNKDDTIIHGNIFNKLCQQQTSFPKYDGTYYEAIGLKVFNEGTLNTYSGTCYQNLNPNDPVSAFGVDDGDY